MTEIGKCPRCGSIGSIIGDRCCWNCLNAWHREQAENMLKNYRDILADPRELEFVARYGKEIKFTIVALEHLIGERSYMVYPGDPEYESSFNGGKRT